MGSESAPVSDQEPLSASSWAFLCCGCGVRKSHLLKRLPERHSQLPVLPTCTLADELDQLPLLRGWLGKEEFARSGRKLHEIQGCSRWRKLDLTKFRFLVAQSILALPGLGSFLIEKHWSNTPVQAVFVKPRNPRFEPIFRGRLHRTPNHLAAGVWELRYSPNNSLGFLAVAALAGARYQIGSRLVGVVVGSFAVEVPAGRLAAPIRSFSIALKPGISSRRADRCRPTTLSTPYDRQNAPAISG